MQAIMRLVFTSLAVLWVGGCSYTVAYNPSLVPPAAPVTKTQGRVLIVMTAEQEEWIYHGHPKNYPEFPGQLKLNIPIGNVTKQIAVDVFGRYFQQADAAQDMKQTDSYHLVVNPVVKRFQYGFVQKGIFSVWQVEINLQVTLYDNGGKELLSRSYESGVKEGSSSISRSSSGVAQIINGMLHENLFELMNQAAKDAVKVNVSQLRHVGDCEDSAARFCERNPDQMWEPV